MFVINASYGYLTLRTSQGQTLTDTDLLRHDLARNFSHPCEVVSWIRSVKLLQDKRSGEVLTSVDVFFDNTLLGAFHRLL